MKHSPPPSDDEDILKWSKAKHENYIGSVSEQPVILQPTASNHQPTNESLEKSIAQVAKLASQLEKKKGFEKLHHSSKNLVLNATYLNGQVKVGTPCDKCKDFSKQNLMVRQKSFSPNQWNATGTAWLK